MADVQHNALTGASLHEPKGVAAAAANTVYVADGAGSGSWSNVASAVFPTGTDYWDSEFHAVQGLRLAGNANDPDVDTADGTFLFDGTTTDELIFDIFEVNRRRATDGEMRFYAVWAKTTGASGDVGWELEYKVLTGSGVPACTYTSLGVETDTITTEDNTAEKIQFTYLSFLDTTSLEDSDLILCQLTRVQSDSGDTYGADVRFYGILCNRETDRLGATAEFP